jgi:hypothetical protein
MFTAGGVALKTPLRPLRPLSKKNMRAEIENLVEETKQSVGLLRRHL